MPSTEARLAAIEANIRSTVDIWKLHTQQDMDQFKAITAAIKEVGEKVDALRIAEARRQGEAIAVKRGAGVLGGAVAAIVVTIIEVARYFIGV